MPRIWAVSSCRSTMWMPCARTLGSRAETGYCQCRPVETLETTSPALSTLRRSSCTSASAVLIWNQGTSPSHSSMPSKPDRLVSSSPFSKLQPLGNILSPMDFFISPSDNARAVLFARCNLTAMTALYLIPKTGHFDDPMVWLDVPCAKPWLAAGFPGGDRG